MVVAVLAALATTGAVLTTASGTSGTSTGPIRAAFYYPWYPETEHWSTHYGPTLGHYDSSDPAVLAAHVAAARYAGLDAFIASWWGQGTPTDKRLPLLLSAAQKGGLSVAPYYEPEGQSPAPSAAQLNSDLQYLYAEAQASPAWLRVNGKPVLFVYNSRSTDCSVATRWKNANAGRFYIDLKVFAGYQNCADQPDSWHQYGPASGFDQQGTYSASVSPGFFKFNESTPRLARDLSRFRTDLQRQVHSGAKWQLMTTFNEWGEGTAVESAAQWASSSGYGAYLDAMHGAYGASPTPNPGSSSASSSSRSSTPVAPPPTSSTTSTTGSLVADADVNSAQPTTNDGTATTVGVDNSPQRYGYFRFQVNVPSTYTVVRATFSCYSISSSASGGIVYPAGNSWDENTVTWQSRPALQTMLGETGALTAHAYSPAVDVTSAIHGSGSYTFAMTTPSTTRWACASRENTGAHPAHLALTLSTGAPSSSSSTPPPSSSSTPPPSSSSSTPPPSSSSTPPPSSSSTPPPSSSSTPPPSSSSTPPPPGQHKVLVIPLENHSQSEALAQMPYLTSLGKAYGSATNYFAVAHPSLPNYLAIFGGSTFGVTSDCSVGSSGCVPAAPSVWGQAAAAGVSARAYQESMTSNCQTSGSGQYAPRHGPWPYWTGAAERSACQANDVPSGTTSGGALASDVAAGTLPVVGELTPNLCNDAHDCSLATADSWLKSWMPAIMNGSDYRAGRLTVIITFDEDDSSQSNKVAFVVVDPRLSGKTVTATANHYSLTRWLDGVAGLTLLRNAASAVDLRSQFGL